MKNIILYFVPLFIHGVLAGKIIDLPNLNFKIYSEQYSGYLNVSKTHRLFYWFIESQNTPSVDPLVLWFNGGPMCSSLFGLFKEHGPFYMRNGNGTFERNEHTWNRMANVVYLESPAGVGYSYSTDGDVLTTDDFVAEENYVAIKEFLKEFPQFREHDIFLTGESYAGIYIPMLVDRIIDGQKEYPINLKGVAIGNGSFSKTLIGQTAWLFGYTHGLVDEHSYRSRIEECCFGVLETCEQYIYTEECVILARYAELRANEAIDSYDLNRMCYSPGINDDQNRYPSCHTDIKDTEYLNSANVRKALHVPDIAPSWQFCADLDFYIKTETEMKSYVRKIVENGIRVLLYHGDLDKVCDFVMGQRFAASLGLKKLAPKLPWYYNNVISGHKVLYEGLTFATIRGASHSPPITHPSEMFYVIQQFFNDKPF